ncbi:MAG: lysophospholipid acyltransferase family protein [Candidatus Omnitrophica bacterium]|nr:lysophospholipid acyltransferase family protein [Candidatus Omnitrophota bacterium]
MWYSVFSWMFLFVFKCFFRLKVEGLENLPQKSNFIIVSNHNSFLDPALIMAAVRKKIYCIALRDIYKMSWLGWFLQVTETLPSGSSSPKAVDLLLKNKIVGLFPEGGVSRDGKLKEFRRGAALLALKTGRPIVPCAIIGTFQALPFGSRIPRLTPLKLKIGKPVFFAKEFEEVIDDIYLQEGMHKLRNIIKGMLDAG